MTPPVVRFHVFVSVTLRAVRRRYRLHPHEVAKHVGLSDAQWARVEAGRSIPTPNHLHDVSALLSLRYTAPDTPTSADITALAERVSEAAIVGTDMTDGPLAVLAVAKEEPAALTRVQLTGLRHLADRIVEAAISAPEGLGIENIHLLDDEDDVDNGDSGDEAPVDG